MNIAALWRAGILGIVLAAQLCLAHSPKKVRVAAHRHQDSLRTGQNSQCPNQGGILDSISVPVNQPITLYVYVSDPPSTDETFEVSSLDASVAAVGDATQGFSPIVTIPAGANDSNPFTLYGVAVGQTTLEVASLSGDYGTSDTPTTAWDLDQGFLDANPPTPDNCRNGAVLSNDPATLSTCGAPVAGVASDGVTALLMRIAAGLAGTACYEIVTSDGLDDGAITTEVTGTQMVGSLDYAFSFFQAPSAIESADDSREVEVQFSFTPSLGNGNTSSFDLSTTIVRPPVMLLHGLWSNSGAWNNFPHKDDTFHTFYAGDYAKSNAANFSANDPVVQKSVGIALSNFRQKGYAGTQADVIAHSMGGILTRMYINSGGFLQNPQNYDLGDIRRLVTLDTPHSGSSFANLLVSLHQASPLPIDWLVDPLGTLTDGAVCDLAENSPALKASLAGGPTQMLARAVTAAGGPTGGYLLPFQLALNANVCAINIGGICLLTVYLFPQDEVNGFAFTEANDAIVAESSQQGGLTDGPNYSDLLHFGFTVPLLGFCLPCGVTNSSEVAQTVYSLLDGPSLRVR